MPKKTCHNKHSGNGRRLYALNFTVKTVQVPNNVPVVVSQAQAEMTAVQPDALINGEIRNYNPKNQS